MEVRDNIDIDNSSSTTSPAAIPEPSHSIIERNNNNNGDPLTTLLLSVSSPNKEEEDVRVREPTDHDSISINTSNHRIPILKDEKELKEEGEEEEIGTNEEDEEKTLLKQNRLFKYYIKHYYNRSNRIHRHLYTTNYYYNQTIEMGIQLSRHHYGPFITLLLLVFISSLINCFINSKLFFWVQVLSLWGVGVSVHELGHASVAYFGGDTSVKEKGYLSLNPFSTMNRYYTLIIPVLLISFGGVSMGLPSGSIDYDESKIYSQYWVSGIGIAGLTFSIAFNIVLSAPFWSGLYLEYFKDSYMWLALSCSIYLEVQTLLFNIIPLPPLDLYIIISPYLGDNIRAFRNKYGHKLDVTCLILCSVVLYHWGDFLWNFTPAITNDLFKVPYMYIHHALQVFYIPSFFGSPDPNQII